MIVRTLLDTDLYKFTTSYAYIKLFPYAMGKFSFHDRNETEYTEEFLERRNGSGSSGDHSDPCGIDFTGHCFQKAADFLGQYHFFKNQEQGR